MNPASFEELLPVVYRELRKIAAGYMRRQIPSITLQPTALVHEAYLRLAAANSHLCQDRAHLCALTAAIMRNILVDRARARRAEKRGGGLTPVNLENCLEPAMGRPADLVALDDALTALAKRDERKAKVLELRYFAGLSVEETAEVLSISITTVGRETRFAEAWLRRELNPQGSASPASRS